MKKNSVLRHFGGVTKTAAALFLTQPTVSQWPEEVPFSAIGRLAVFQPKALAAIQRLERQEKHDAAA